MSCNRVCGTRNACYVPQPSSGYDDTASAPRQHPDPVDTANRSIGPLKLMTRLSAWPECPGRAPPGVPVGGNRAVDAAFPVSRGLLRIEGAVAAGRHKDLFTAQAISRLCRPGFAKAHPTGASRGANARGLPQSTALSPPLLGRWRCQKPPPLTAEDIRSPQNRDAREQGFRPGRIPAHGAVSFLSADLHRLGLWTRCIMLMRLVGDPSLRQEPQSSNNIYNLSCPDETRRLTANSGQYLRSTL
jgi:hypothetical protein